MGYKKGAIGENFFSSLLYACGIKYNFVDDWYDYLVEDIKVEVKSCQLTIKGTSKLKGKELKEGYKIGQFDFTSKENRERIIKEDVWIALIVRHRRQCIFYGFIKGSQLNGSRYLTLHKARDLKPINLNEWILINNLKKDYTGKCVHCGTDLLHPCDL